MADLAKMKERLAKQREKNKENVNVEIKVKEKKYKVFAKNQRHLDERATEETLLRLS